MLKKNQEQGVISIKRTKNECTVFETYCHLSLHNYRFLVLIFVITKYKTNRKYRRDFNAKVSSFIYIYIFTKS